MRRRLPLLLLFLPLLLAACGGGTPAAPTPPAGNTNQVVISPAGAVSPTEIVVAPGSRVLFVNNDSRRHMMMSDPHPDHTDCPAINTVGLLQPGEKRETSNLVVTRTCGFHDHENPGVSSLRGHVVIR